MVEIKPIKELLERYRQQLHGVIDPADDALLRRWQDDEGANEGLKALAEIVAKIEKTARAGGEGFIGPDFQIEIAAFLIPEILVARDHAKNEDELSSAIVKRGKEVKTLGKIVRAKLAKKISSEQIPNHHLPAYLEPALAKLRHVRATNKPSIRVRSGAGRVRIRTLFIHYLSSLIHDLTNRWMDEQVAALAALVLGGEIDIATVRNARRPTTRKARRTR